MNLKQKKKQLIAAALALLLSVGTAVPAVITSAPAVSAAQNDSVEYADDDGSVYEVSRDGTLLRFIPDYNVTEVSIPETIEGITITKIGDNAFYGRGYYEDGIYISYSWNRVSRIELPNTVKSIGVHAFTYSLDLQSVKLPDGLKKIENYTFFKCRDLEEIEIPDSVTSIGESAFWECKSLTSITLPKNLTEIGSSAFYGCEKLEEITIPNKVKEIGYCAFSQCYGLKEVHLSNSVESIGDVAFASCKNLNDIYYDGSRIEWINSLAGYNVFSDAASPTIHTTKSSQNTLTEPTAPTTPDTAEPTPPTTPTEPTIQTPPTTPTTPTTPAPTTPVVKHDKGSIMLDTANYIMAPGNIYDVGVTVKDAQGNSLSGNQVKNLVSSGKLKVTDSRTGSIATLQQLPNGNFRVTGKNPGTCYIVYDIGGTHASVKIDVQRGVKQHGTAVRNTSYLTQDISIPKASAAVVGTWKIGSIVKDGKSYTIRNYFINELKAQGVTSAQINSSEGVQALNLMTSVFDSFSITFNQDGSVVSTASANGQTSSANGTYTMNGNNVVITVNGETTTYKYNPSQDTVTASNQGLTVVLARR